MSRRVPARTDAAGLRAAPGARNKSDPTTRRIANEAYPLMALMLSLLEQQNKLIEELTQGVVHLDVKSEGKDKIAKTVMEMW